MTLDISEVRSRTYYSCRVFNEVFALTHPSERAKTHLSPNKSASNH
jgi:hypothetical protein